jgi:hypothetical protein
VIVSSKPVDNSHQPLQGSYQAALFVSNFPPTTMNPIYKLLPSTRNEAIIADSAYYFTATKCVRGHTAPRYASNKHCMECSREDTYKHRKDDLKRCIEGALRIIYSEDGDITCSDKEAIKFLPRLHAGLIRYQGTFSKDDPKHIVATNDSVIELVIDDLKGLMT